MSDIPLDQLEGAAIDLLDILAYMARPPLPKEKRQIRSILAPYKDAAGAPAFAKLDTQEREHHLFLIRSLEEAAEPAAAPADAMEEMPLDQLKDESVAFLRWADTLGRPLLPSEQYARRKITLLWESKSIRKALAEMDGQAAVFYFDLLKQIREAFEPDPIAGDGRRPTRLTPLKREGAIAQADLHEGNFALKRPDVLPSVRSLNVPETVELLSFIERMGKGAAAGCWHLALVNPVHRDAALDIAWLSKRLCAKVLDFLRRPHPVPARPSLDEKIAGARFIGSLLSAQDAGGD